MDEGAGPVGADEPGHEAMTRKLKAKVRWPDLNTSPETWSNAELRGVSINPVATGIGRHPRSISDEDWVLHCERDIEDNGLAQFLTDLLHVLRLTVPNTWASRNRLAIIPSDGRRARFHCPMLLIRATVIGTKTAGTRRWLGDILCNPVLAGIPPFKAAVDEQAWIAAGVRMVGEVGLRQYLVNVLYQLKKSISGVSPE